MELEGTEKLYPRLSTPTAPIENDYTNANVLDTHRLDYIHSIQKYIEKNSEDRRALSKKYSKANNILQYISYGLNTIATTSGIVSVSTLPTIAMIPLSLILGGVSIGSSFFSIIVIKVNKKLKNKETKHRDIYNLCENKLNLINSLISKALQDNNISDDEFQLILKEEKHFRLHKENIRRKNREQFFNEDKVKEQCKKELKESLLEPLNNLATAINKK